MIEAFLERCHLTAVGLAFGRQHGRALWRQERRLNVIRFSPAALLRFALIMGAARGAN